MRAHSLTYHYTCNEHSSLLIALIFYIRYTRPVKDTVCGTGESTIERARRKERVISISLDLEMEMQLATGERKKYKRESQHVQ